MIPSYVKIQNLNVLEHTVYYFSNLRKLESTISKIIKCKIIEFYKRNQYVYLVLEFDNPT